MRRTHKLVASRGQRLSNAQPRFCSGEMKLENSRWAAIVNPALKLFFNDQLELLLASFIKTYATP